MVTTTLEPAARDTDVYLEKFERFVEPTVGQQSAWLLPRRQAALARFLEQGFPTTQDEDWRFTNVAPITRLPFRPMLVADGELPAREVLARRTFAGLPGTRLVFVNGHYAAALSTRRPLPKGVVVTSLGEAFAAADARLEQHLGHLASMPDHAFAALNTAFFQDGAFLYVPAGAEVADPVHLVFLSTGEESGVTSFPRVLIVAEAGSRLTVLESYGSATEARTVTNAVTECVLGDEAVVEHLKFQDESSHAGHVGTLQAQLGRASNYLAHSFALGARLARNNIRATLAGEGLECVLNGLYLTRGEQLVDHHMVVEHAQPHCASHEYFNGILDDASKGVFHGRILVQPIAQKTDAKQTNKNLLLSDDATVDTKPQLEIYADDVKCTHGATVGQMNEEAIFYLRARGIGRANARRLLMHAFAGEIIERVRCEPARDELDRLVWDRLEQNPHIADRA